MTIAIARAPQFSGSLLGRGALMLAFGAIALRWPVSSLGQAIVAAGAILATSGVYEMSLAVDARRTSARWPVLLLDGAACVVFGVITLGFLALTLGTAMLVVAGWLTLYAAFCASLALLPWTRRGPRLMLWAWGATNLALAIGAVLLPRPDVNVVLYAGAAYAALFGIVQLIAGMWLRSQLVTVPSGESIP